MKPANEAATKRSFMVIQLPSRSIRWEEEKADIYLTRTFFLIHTTNVHSNLILKWFNFLVVCLFIGICGSLECQRYSKCNIATIMVHHSIIVFAISHSLYHSALIQFQFSWKKNILTALNMFNWKFRTQCYVHNAPNWLGWFARSFVALNMYRIFILCWISKQKIVQARTMNSVEEQQRRLKTPHEHVITIFNRNNYFDSSHICLPYGSQTDSKYS